MIIPTHRRPQILAKCLEHLERQTVVDRIEVIVVHDGLDAAETEHVAMRTWKMKVSYVEIEKSQQGAARNRGVREASAPLVLFIGDDAFLAPDACEIHLQMHAETNTSKPANQQTSEQIPDQVHMHPKQRAILGHTTWDPAVGVTPVMQWLEKSGWQFGYPAITPYAGKAIPRELQHRFTYTIHISLPTQIAREHPFREDIALYGWEDIEWGLRLAQRGIPLIYAPEARALHHHYMTFEDSLRRMETIGRSVRIFDRVAPGFDRMPRGWKKWAYQGHALLPTMAGKHRKAFLRGLREENSSEYQRRD